MAMLRALPLSLASPLVNSTGAELIQEKNSSVEILTEKLATLISKSRLQEMKNALVRVRPQSDAREQLIKACEEVVYG